MKVLIAGHTGLVGGALYRYFTSKGFTTYGVSSREADLRDLNQTLNVVEEFRPNLIIDAAAKVGGVGANIKFPVDFLEDNLKIQSNLMGAAHSMDVEKFVFLGSSCIYPRDITQPIPEQALLSSYLEPTNTAYAIAKISGVVAINSYFQQHKRSWFSVMPCNLYGEQDNFDQESGHVVASLISKFCDAVTLGIDEVEVWGSGNPRREFMYADDLPEAIFLLLSENTGGTHFNVGFGEDISIRELVNLIVEVSGFKGKVIWNSTKPDGIHRKLLDSSRVRKLGWNPKTDFRSGIERVIQHYLSNRAALRGVRPLA